MKKSTLSLFLAIYSTTLLAAIPARADQECAAKVLATCTKCHYQTRICEKLGKKSKREWKTTIKLMLRYGLVLNDSDQENMLKCLMSLDKNSDKLCK